jgi:hypothetical protein
MLPETHRKLALVRWKTMLMRLPSMASACGTTQGLAAMATHTSVDYSTRLRGFHGGAPEDAEDIEVILERLDGHGDDIADSIHTQSMLKRLFD